MSRPHEHDPHAGHAAHQMAPSASSSAPPSAASTSSQTAAPNIAAAVRLPPVPLPSADLFVHSAFAGGRRQSINSDPFLHAFSVAHDVGTGHARPGDPYRLTPTAGAISHVQDGLPHPNVHPQTGASAANANGAGGSANGLHERWHPGLESGFPGYPPTSGPTQHDGFYGPPGEQHFAPSPSVGPLSSYRFGGPSQTPLGSSTPASAAPTDAPSYVDYSMRRASLSHPANEPVSPRRAPSGRASPATGVKRKAQDEGDAGRGQSPYLGGLGQHAGGLPDSKRQPSTLGGSDKLGQSGALNGQQDMGLPGPHVAPWEEQRRDSGGSYASSGGHSYSMTSYAPPHSMPSSSSTTYDSRPPSAPAPNPHMPAGSPWDGRGQQTHYNPLEQAAAGAAMFPRRPSIPSVSQMMQGLPSGFVGSSNAPGGPPGSAPSFVGAARPGQPALTVSSVPATPSEREHPRQSRSASNPAFQSAEPAPQPPHAGSRSDWQTHSQASTRHNSSGSIHLDPLSLAGGLMNKDSPYSRSPELRVSHKLAERKRRKEMTQLFEDLRDSLPFERGLKASKWEILSKAIEYVAQLKSYTAELADDNRNLRQHYGLPPGPAMAGHDGPSDGGRGGVAGGPHPQCDGRPLQESRGASPRGGMPAGVANAVPNAQSRQLQWHEQHLFDPDAMQDRKPNPAHFAKQTGHSPVIPSRLHSQFGTSSQHSTPQPSPTLPPSSTTGSGRNTPAVGTDSPHPLERSMTGPPVSAA